MHSSPSFPECLPATCPAARRRAERTQERLYYASQRQLVWHTFKKHKLALISLGGLIILYMVTIFADFIAPYGALDRFRDYNDTPPTVSPFHRRKRRAQPSVRL